MELLSSAVLANVWGLCWRRIDFFQWQFISSDFSVQVSSNNRVCKQQTLQLPHFWAALCVCVCVHACVYLYVSRYRFSFSSNKNELAIHYLPHSPIPGLVRTSPSLNAFWVCMLDSSNNPQSYPALWKSQPPYHRFIGWEIGQNLRVCAMAHIRIQKYLTLASGRCIFFLPVFHWKIMQYYTSC